jgi:hypothetical protein
MTMRHLIGMTLIVGLAACNGAGTQDLPAGEKAAGGRPSGTAAKRVSESTTRTVGAGTRISATMQDALSSRTAKPGERTQATVSRDVTDSQGNVGIPAGSIVSVTIDQLEPGSDQVRPEGRISFSVNSISVRGQSYEIAGDVDPVAHTMKGRGITTDEAARVGAGAAVGAIVGQAIGKNQKGTIIGGAVGTVAGGAVAARYALRDIIVAAGTPITFTLSKAVTVAAR